MLSFVLLATLAAEPNADLDAFLTVVEQQTQHAIDDSPRVIQEFKAGIQNSSGAQRRALLAEIRLYEMRIKELRAGKSVVIPLISFDRRPGEIGRIPSPVKLIEKVGKDCVVEADWNKPQPNLIDQIPAAEAEAPNRTARLLFKGFNATPFQIGQEFDIGVICVTGGQEVRRGQAMTVINQLDISETKIPKMIQQRKRGARLE